MIAIETNVLIYAHRKEAPEHTQAADCLRTLIESAAPCAIPWPCVHEFLSTVTKSIFRPATTIDTAFAAISSLLASENVHLIGESEDHLSLLHRLCRRGHVTGGAVHDARIAAICLGNGISELWSADRNFSRFPDLKVVNPLVT